MLLSMYLMYRYAHSGKSWSYLFDIGLFVVLISLVSALVPVTQFVFFTFPMSFLSFPFYFWIGELAAPASLSPQIREISPWLYFHSVRFLTVDLNLTPDWEVSGGQLFTYGELNYNNALVIAFSILFFVNVLGGVIGYLVGRRFELSGLSEERWVIVGVVAIVLAFVSGIVVGAGFPFVNWSIVWLVLTVVLGFGVIVLEAAFLWFLVGLAEQSRVASLMVLGGLILLLTGRAFNQLLTTTAGFALFLFGGIIYFAKAVITYVRTHEPQTSPEKPVEE